MIGPLDKVIRDVFELPKPKRRRNEGDNDDKMGRRQETSEASLDCEKEAAMTPTTTSTERSPNTAVSSGAEEWSINVHAKSRELHVAWLAPIYNPFVRKHPQTSDDVESLHHVAKIAEAPARIAHCLRQLRGSPAWQNLRAFTVLDAIRAPVRNGSHAGAL